MKIIKEGNPDRLRAVKKFSCRKCGCVFEAERGEYTSGSQYNETYYCCECPCCHSYAYEENSR